MNTQRPALHSLLLASALIAQSASAANLYWDTNGTGSAGSGAATGNWGLDASWSTDSTGLNVGPVTLTAATTGVDDLFFSAGTTGTGGTVTVDASKTARKLTFEEGAITLSGGTLITLAGGGGITVDAAAGNATVSTALTATGKNTFIVGAGRTLTLDTGAFTRTTRGALNIQLGAGSTLTSTKTNLAANDATGIIGPWASFGTDATTTYAKFSGTNIVGLGYTGVADGVSVAAAANVVTGAGNLNYTLSAAGTLGASASVNTLRYTGAAGTLTSSTLFTTKGIMLTGASNLTLLGGAGWSSGASATELVVNVVQATSELRMNGSTAAITGSINKTGAGIFDMRSGAAHSIGNITVNEGILITNHLNGDGIGGSATINSGGTLRWGGSSKHQNAAGFTINAGGTLDIVNFDDLIGSVSGAGNITGTTGRIQVQNATATFSGVMSGSGVRFLINDDGGANDYTLSGLNTYGGTTTLERGILRINSIGNVNGSASSLGTPTSVANGNIAIGRLGFTGTLVYTGTGHGTDRQITIGTNTGTPVVTDTGGATIQADGAANAALTFNATTFNTQTNASAGAGADRVLTLQGSSTGLNTISGIIQDNLVSGTATGTAKIGVTKAQAGTWVLSGPNTYTGINTITEGTLQVNNPTNGLGNATAANTINLNGGTLSLRNDGAGNNGSITYGSTSNSGGYKLQLSATSTINVANLTANTGNTIALSAFTQATAVARTLNVTGANGYSLTLASLGLNPGTGQNTTLNPTLASLIITGDVTNPMSGFGPSNFDTLTLGGTSTGNSIGGSITDAVGGSIAAGGYTNVTKNNTSSWTLSGTGSTYSGTTTISGGTLRLGAAGVIPNASSVSVTGTGTLDLNGNSETINGLSGNGTVDNAAASTSATLTVGGGGTFSGSITDSGASASLALVKSGSGADLILDGNNSYSGGTTLNSGGVGRMFIASSTALPTTGAVQVNSGATLNINAGGSPTFGQSITLASGAALAVRQAAILGDVTLPTAGSVIFNRDDVATVAFSLGNNVGLTGDLTVQVGNVGGGGHATVGDVTLGGDISGGFGLTKTEVGKLTLSGTNAYTGNTTVSGGTLEVKGSITDTVAITTVTNARLQGSGLITGPVTIGSGGTLAPGNSIESFGTGNIKFESVSTFAYEFDTNFSDSNKSGDLNYSSGTLTIDSGAYITLDDVQTTSNALALGTKLTLISYTGGWTSSQLFTYGVETLTDGAILTLGSNKWEFDYDDEVKGKNYASDATGNRFVTMTVVPEAGTAGLLALGLLLLRRLRRR